MAGLSDNEADADLDDADSIAIEEGRTGLDLLLRSLGHPFPPPAPTTLGPVPMVPENPDVPSSPDSIRANPPVLPGVSNTVHIGTSASKLSAARAIKLKLQKLSFWTSSTTVPVSEAVVNETTAHPALNINVQELIDAIYAEALEKYKSKWVEHFPWLVLTKTVRGLPAFKCSLCTKHAGVRGRCGRTGKGVTNVQTQAFHKHTGTRKHKLALEKQEALLAAASKQPRIDEHRAAVDAEKIRVTSLLDVLLFTTQLEHILRSPFIGIAIDESTDRVKGKHLILYATFVRESVVVTEFMQLITVEKADASTLLSLLLSHLQAVGVDLQRISGISTDGASWMMGSQAGLVVRLREKVPHLVSCHRITHREALAAKDAAEALPVFNMVDDLIRVVSDLLGQPGPKHQRFMDLHELFTETSLEVQGIHQVRWLSRGDALLRILAVWPAVIVFLKEFHAAMFLLATSYRFHFFMYFLADVLEQLNFLNKTFQQRQIKRTTSHIESRYVDCGDDFGGGLSHWLSPFIEHYGPGKERKVCTDFAERIVGNLERRLSDLDSLSGVRLFLPDEWPKSKSERHARCVEWLNSLVTLFKAHAAEDILPGINKLQAHKELRLFCSVRAAAPKGERTFHDGLTAILKTSDWRESYPNLVQLWVAVAVIPLSTVECERGFSRQNVIKSWLRSGLKDARLGDLIPPRLSPSVLSSPRELALTASLSTPVTDYYRTYLPILSRVLASLVTDPRASLSSVSVLTAAITEFASTRCLDYTTSLVAAPPTSPLAIGGESALGCDALEDRQFELEFLAATSPHLCAMLLTVEGDPDALDILIPRTYAEAVLGPWASHWAAMDSAMASYRSTVTSIDEVPPPGANVVDGMWIFRVKWPP
ncbi:unnamed protein product [Closterium sp. NIES-54]